MTGEPCELRLIGCDGEAVTTVQHDFDIPACQSCATRWDGMYRQTTRSEWEFGDSVPDDGEPEDAA